jgi:predicted Zn-dependent peptidase
MTILKRNLEEGAGLFADAVLRPRFDESEWGRVHSLRLEDLRQRAEVPSAAAAVVGERLLFGDDNAYAWPSEGMEWTVESITLGDARDAQPSLLRPGTSTLLIAGDVSGSEARELAERMFGEWSGQASSSASGRAAGPAPSGSEDLRVLLVDRPGATQTYIRFTAPGIAYGDESRVETRLLNVILGGSFTSRLNQNLREDKGYTYGARSRFRMLDDAGSVSATASVQAEVTGASLAEFTKEFARIRAGDITEEEAAKASEMLRNDTISEFQGLSGLVGAAAERVVHGLDFATISVDLAETGEIDAAELNELGRRVLPIERGVLVLVGDKSVILPQLEGLGLPEPEEFDASGNRLGDE